MKVVLFLILIAIANTSQAAYQSQQQLFSAMGSIGLDQMIQVTDISRTQNLKIINTESQISNSVAIEPGNFSNAIRMTSLDFKESSLVSFEAYAIEENILCYKSTEYTPSRSPRPREMYSQCYILPTAVKNVVSALQRKI